VGIDIIAPTLKAAGKYVLTRDSGALAWKAEDIDIDALFWARRGLKLSDPFTAYPPKIIGRCNDLTRGKYWSEAASDYMDYKSLLKLELNIPEDLVKVADGIVIEAEFGLPKSCLKKDGTPTLEGDRRLKGLVKLIPQDWDNIGKPIQDAVAKTEGGIKDASVMVGMVTKRWGLENKITVRLLLPLEN